MCVCVCARVAMTPFVQQQQQQQQQRQQGLSPRAQWAHSCNACCRGSVKLAHNPPNIGSQHALV